MDSEEEGRDSGEAVMDLVEVKMDSGEAAMVQLAPEVAAKVLPEAEETVVAVKVGVTAVAAVVVAEAAAARAAVAAAAAARAAAVTVAAGEMERETVVAGWEAAGAAAAKAATVVVARTTHLCKRSSRPADLHPTMFVLYTDRGWFQSIRTIENLCPRTDDSG